MHVPDDPGYYEKFYFTPGDLGFQPIKTSLGKLGVLICWDQWFPEAARLMALKGADLLIYPTAIGFDKQDSKEERERQLNAWKIIQQSHAIANGIPIIVVNRTGIETAQDKTNETQFWGSSFIAGAQGEVLFQAPQNSESIHVSKISLNRTEEVRRTWPFLRDRRIDKYIDLTKVFID
jgi:N-carbamoylputrescine amidase